MSLMSIRLETPRDFGVVERLTLAAFGNFTYPDGSRDPEICEHYLVHTMRDCGAFIPELAFVGEIDGEITANIMYTKSKVVRADNSVTETITFGPVSVKPELQKQGLGSEIIRHSLSAARMLGYGAVIILGHPAYYPRFGFSRAEKFGLSVASHGDEVFDGAFMALELRDGYLGLGGGEWHEDKVFDINHAEFGAWNKEFMAIDDYITNQQESIRPILSKVLSIIREELPNATEIISWQMPTFWHGRNLIHFAAQKNHLGVYPGSEAVEHFLPQLIGYKTSKGAIQFPYKGFGDAQLKLIADIAAWCAAHIDGGYMELYRK